MGAEFIALKEFGYCESEWDAHELDHGGRKLSTFARAQERGYVSVAQFNDASKTKQEDVVAFLDEYIAELEGAK